MQDIKRELRDRDSNANTRIYFVIRATALHPRLHTERLSLSTKDLLQRDLHQRITNTNKEYTTPTLSHTSTQEGRH